jgi:hypothetical protein
LLRCSVLRHLRLDGPSGSSNAPRLTKLSVLVEEVVFGVVVLTVNFFGGVFGGVFRDDGDMEELSSREAGWL